MVQDVFINLWKTRENIESSLHLKMYVYQSMRHRCLNYLQERKVHEKYYKEYLLEEAEEDYQDRVVEEEVHRLVIAEINRLPAEQRRVLSLHLEGNNNNEIAEIMQVSVNTVKTHKARARQQLKIKLKDLFIISVVLGL